MSQEIIHLAKGVLHYSRGQSGGYRLVSDVNQELSDYYRSLIPKYIHVNPQRYSAHISIVRNEVPVHKEWWGKYEGEVVEFYYSPLIKSGKVYFWLDVFCQRFEEIRQELGLPVSTEYTRPPDGFVKCFHMTIGNLKS